MNSFQRICRSPAFLVLALILCAAVIAGGVALAPAAPKVWIVIPVLLAVAAKKERGGKRGCGKSRP